MHYRILGVNIPNALQSLQNEPHFLVVLRHPAFARDISLYFLSGKRYNWIRFRKKIRV